MKTTWTWSLELEANRILQASKNIGSGFYVSNNFPILPWSPQVKYLPQAVYLPTLNYSTLSRFWHKTSKYNIHSLPIQDPNNYTSALLTKLISLNLTDPTDSSLVKLWQQQQDNILKVISNLLPHTHNQISSLTIHPTYFGASSSFSVPHDFPADITIYLRIDQGIHAIIESILTALTRHDVYSNYHALWSESEFLVDYLLDRSPLHSYIKNIAPSSVMQGTIPNNRSNLKHNILKQSHSFLTSIGAPTFDQPFSITNSLPQFNHHPILNLTNRESTILQTLTTSSPDLVTYNQLADLIFKNDADYSLQTIAKVVERLRHKLDKQGISSSYLVTARNQGYYLKN